jgi:hypothetical protein
MPTKIATGTDVSNVEVEAAAPTGAAISRNRAPAIPNDRGSLAFIRPSSLTPDASNFEFRLAGQIASPLLVASVTLYGAL